MRELPSLAEPGAAFWTSGADQVLTIAWCAACGCYLHPASTVCPYCFASPLPRAVAGTATVVAASTNHHAWLPGHVPPYVVAIVELDAAPSVRLTTNLIDCPTADDYLGLAVEVRFMQHEDVWLPCFAPRPSARRGAVADPLPLSRRTPPVLTRGDKYEDRVAITGIGQSALGRKLAQSATALSIDACRAALDDAGLRVADIDGLCAYPGSDGLPGISQGGVRMVEAALGIQPLWHCGAHEVAGQTGNLQVAMLAVASGLCRHVLCFTNFAQAQRPSALARQSGRITGELAWQLPYGAASPANWIALYASHYLHRFGVPREALAGIAIAARQHAARNPQALYQAALSLDDYLAARMIAWPFGLYDCDVPCDGAMAVVISARGASADLRQPAIWVEAVGSHITEHQSWDQGPLSQQRNVFGPAAHLWSRTCLRAADVDVALLYDGFTFNVFSWLEGLGFCAPGEAAQFIDGGARLGPGGALPLNPHGGQLAAGRSNGYGNVLEAVTQLRHQAGARQVAAARVAVVSSGGGIPAGCMLLRND